jgi:hypothetical protein
MAPIDFASHREKLNLTMTEGELNWNPESSTPLLPMMYPL